MFVDVDDFMRLRDAGEMLEHAQVFDNYYATSRSQVEKHLQDNRSVVLEIDWQGAEQVRESMPDCVSIFILPPSHAELERRLSALERAVTNSKPQEASRRPVYANQWEDIANWRKLQIGMTRLQVEQLMGGAPDKISRVSSDSEICYFGKVGRGGHVIFRKGRVASWNEP